MKHKSAPSKSHLLINLLRFAAIASCTIAAVLYVNRNNRIFGQRATTLRTLPLRLGAHSANPSLAYFEGFRDPISDQLNSMHRASKDLRMRDSHKELHDPGLVINGRSHDLSMRVIDYETPQEALPSQHATAIVIGTLAASHGFVGSEHTSVYTEHQFNVERVLKSDDTSLVPGSQVIGTRLGGTVVFPSGHLKDYVVYGEGIPKVGGRYLLFLWRAAGQSEPDYGICTAYELSDGKAYALDAVKPYTQYEGTDEAALLAATRVSFQTGGN
jgi:hypothetical protein